MDFFYVVQDMCKVDIVILSDMVGLIVFIFQCDQVQMGCNFIGDILQVGIYCIRNKCVSYSGLFKDVVWVMCWEGIKDVFQVVCVFDYLFEVGVGNFGIVVQMQQCIINVLFDQIVIYGGLIFQIDFRFVM